MTFMTKWTVEKLDEMRVGILKECLAGLVVDEETFGLAMSLAISAAKALRLSYETNSIPTEAILAVMNGEAVIVPKEPTDEQIDIGHVAVQKARCSQSAGGQTMDVSLSFLHRIERSAYGAMLAASPWAKKE